MARFHMSKALSTIMYASIVSRETVRIALMIATLNELEGKSGNILNGYVQAPVIKKVWNTLGTEFGKDARKAAVIVRALVCLKLARAAFRSHLAKYIESLRYESCKANPDLWLKPDTRPSVEIQCFFLSFVLCGWHFMHPSQGRCFATAITLVLFQSIHDLATQTCT